MLENGGIFIPRELMQWRWYKDLNTAHLFQHLLLLANWKEGCFREKTIRRGQLVTSYKSLSDGSGLTIRNVRTAIDHLKKTGDIEVVAFNKYSIITIAEYDRYTSLGDTQLTSNRQTTDTQLTSNRQTTDNKIIKQESNNNTPPTPSNEGDAAPKAKKTRTAKPEPVLTAEEKERLPAELHSGVQEWLAYKHHRREDYTAEGRKNVLSQIIRHAQESGSGKVKALLSLCMGNEWRGIIWDKLDSVKAEETESGQGGTWTEWVEDEKEKDEFGNPKLYCIVHGGAEC